MTNHEDAAVLNIKGIDAGRAERYYEAKRYFSKVIELEPGFKHVWYNKGVTLFNLGEYHRAIECFDKAYKMEPDLEEALYNKGICLAKIGRYAGSIVCLNEASQRESRIHNNIDVKFYSEYNKGTAFSRLERYEEAVECFGNATKMFEAIKQSNNHNLDIEESEHALAWYNKGYAHGKLKEYLGALECFNKAIEIDKYNVDAWRNKAFVLFKLDEEERKRDGTKAKECLGYFDKAIEIDPTFVYSWNTKDYALNSLGVREKNEKYKTDYFARAGDCFKKAQELDPQFAPGWYNYGYTLSCLAELEKDKDKDKLEKNSSALQCFDRAIEIDPKNYHARNYKAYALFDLGRYSKAIECFEKTIEIDEDNAYAWMGKGLAHFSLGEYREAIICFKRLSRMDKRAISIPHYTIEVLAWNNIGFALTYISKKEYHTIRKICSLESPKEAEPERTENVNLNNGSENDSEKVKCAHHALGCFQFCEDLMESNKDLMDTNKLTYADILCRGLCS